MVDFYEVGSFISENIFTDKVTVSNVDIPLVFLAEKPKEIETETYITYAFRELEGGNKYRHFAVEITVCSKNISDVYDLRGKIIENMDFYYKPCEIENIHKFIFSNEGGVYHDDIAGYYRDTLYFDCKKI